MCMLSLGLVCTVRAQAHYSTSCDLADKFRREFSIVVYALQRGLLARHSAMGDLEPLRVPWQCTDGGWASAGRRRLR